MEHEINQPSGLPFKKLITGDQVAELLGVSPRHVDHLRQRRLLPFVRLGRVIRFDPDALAGAISQLTVTARG